MAAETETFRESERKKALEKKEKETFVQIDKLSLPREREREREKLWFGVEGGIWREKRGGRGNRGSGTQ
jgi:hypothetical protein